MSRVPPSTVGSRMKAQLMENSGGVMVPSALPVARRFVGALATPASAACANCACISAVS